MGENSHNHNPNPSRLGPRSSTTAAAAVGEIVEVQGGHIVRSIGRKDRHSKVCTAKGPRDRRVRLAAHTAIQFYDVQDRLGYDRPSKAVDWLIKKAKSAIDELDHLPAWHPTAQKVTIGTEQVQKKLEEDEQQQLGFSPSSSKRAMAMLGDGNEQQNTSFLPPSLDSDAIADTIKSFFPMGASAESSSSAMQFQSFSNSHSQDLRLSLQSFQEPIMLHHPNHHHQNPNHHHHTEQSHSQSQQVLLSAIPLGFDSATTWPDHHHQAATELSRFQRPPVWNPGGDSGGGGSGGAGAGYFFNSPQQLQQLLGGHSHSHSHNQYFTQRGPLQSSNTPSVRAWIDPSSGDHNNPPFMPIYPSSISGIGFSSGFHIPARIQGDEEEHDGYSDKPSSASSDSRH